MSTQLPDNVVAFNALTGRVLLKLFEAFPTPIDLEANSFFPQDALSLIDTAASDERWVFFEDTVRWLRDEGYLKFRLEPGLQTFNPTFRMAQLTQHGMGTLTKPLSSLLSKESKKTIGEQLMAAAKGGAVKGVGSAAIEASKFEFAHIIAQLFQGL